MFNTRTERALAALAALIAVPALYGAYAWAANDPRSQVVADTSRYSRISPEVIAMIEKGEADFMARDAVKLGDSITEDFVWYRVGPDGPVEAVRGRDNTVKLMQQFFTVDAPGGFESKVYRLGMVGNILIQVEVDKYESKTEGKVEKTSLEIYEFRDGRRFREWRLIPTASPFDK
jgi:ketosteroid isomerase-like protein